MSQLESGSVVWVRLGQAWWPGSITTVAKCPPEFVQALKKTPIAIVKFFHENEYQDVHKSEHILPYNCDRKEELIRKGQSVNKNQSHGEVDLLAKFESDVVTAEKLTGGDMNILQTLEEVAGSGSDPGCCPPSSPPQPHPILFHTLSPQGKVEPGVGEPEGVDSSQVRSPTTTSIPRKTNSGSCGSNVSTLLHPPSVTFICDSSEVRCAYLENIGVETLNNNDSKVDNSSVYMTSDVLIKDSGVSKMISENEKLAPVNLKEDCVDSGSSCSDQSLVCDEFPKNIGSSVGGNGSSKRDYSGLNDINVGVREDIGNLLGDDSLQEHVSGNVCSEEKVTDSQSHGGDLQKDNCDLQEGVCDTQKDCRASQEDTSYFLKKIEDSQDENEDLQKDEDDVDMKDWQKKTDGLHEDSGSREVGSSSSEECRSDLNKDSDILVEDVGNSVENKDGTGVESIGLRKDSDSLKKDSNVELQVHDDMKDRSDIGENSNSSVEASGGLRVEYGSSELEYSCSLDDGSSKESTDMKSNDKSVEDYDSSLEMSGNGLDWNDVLKGGGGGDMKKGNGLVSESDIEIMNRASEADCDGLRGTFDVKVSSTSLKDNRELVAGDFGGIEGDSSDSGDSSQSDIGSCDSEIGDTNIDGNDTVDINNHTECVKSGNIGSVENDGKNYYTSNVNDSDSDVNDCGDGNDSSMDVNDGSGDGIDNNMDVNDGSGDGIDSNMDVNDDNSDKKGDNMDGNDDDDGNNGSMRVNDDDDGNNGSMRVNDDDGNTSDDSMGVNDGGKCRKDNSMGVNDDGINRKDDSMGVNDDGVNRKGDNMGVNDDGDNRKDDSMGVNVDGVNRKDDSMGVNDDGSNRKDDNMDVNDDASNRKDDTMGVNIDGVNRKDDSMGVNDDVSNRKDDNMDVNDDGSNRKDDSMSVNDGDAGNDTVVNQDGSDGNDDDIIGVNDDYDDGNDSTYLVNDDSSDGNDDHADDDNTSDVSGDSDSSGDVFNDSASHKREDLEVTDCDQVDSSFLAGRSFEDGSDSEEDSCKFEVDGDGSRMSGSISEKGEGFSYLKECSDRNKGDLKGNSFAMEMDDGSEVGGNSLGVEKVGGGGNSLGVEKVSGSLRKDSDKDEGDLKDIKRVKGSSKGNGCALEISDDLEVGDFSLDKKEDCVFLRKVSGKEGLDDIDRTEGIIKGNSCASEVVDGSKEDIGTSEEEDGSSLREDSVRDIDHPESTDRGVGDLKGNNCTLETDDDSRTDGGRSDKEVSGESLREDSSKNIGGSEVSSSCLETDASSTEHDDDSLRDDIDKGTESPVMSIYGTEIDDDSSVVDGCSLKEEDEKLCALRAGNKKIREAEYEIRQNLITDRLNDRDLVSSKMETSGDKAGAEVQAVFASNAGDLNILGNCGGHITVGSSSDHNVESNSSDLAVPDSGDLCVDVGNLVDPRPGDSGDARVSVGNSGALSGILRIKMMDDIQVKKLNEKKCDIAQECTVTSLKVDINSLQSDSELQVYDCDQQTQIATNSNSTKADINESLASYSLISTSDKQENNKKQVCTESWHIYQEGECQEHLQSTNATTFSMEHGHVLGISSLDVTTLLPKPRIDSDSLNVACMTVENKAVSEITKPSSPSQYRFAPNTPPCSLHPLVTSCSICPQTTSCTSSSCAASCNVHPSNKMTTILPHNTPFLGTASKNHLSTKDLQNDDTIYSKHNTANIPVLGEELPPRLSSPPEVGKHLVESGTYGGKMKKPSDGQKNSQIHSSEKLPAGCLELEAESEKGLVQMRNIAPKKQLPKHKFKQKELCFVFTDSVKKEESSVVKMEIGEKQDTVKKEELHKWTDSSSTSAAQCMETSHFQKSEVEGASALSTPRNVITKIETYLDRMTSVEEGLMKNFSHTKPDKTEDVKGVICVEKEHEIDKTVSDAQSDVIKVGLQFNEKTFTVNRQITAEEIQDTSHCVIKKMKETTAHEKSEVSDDEMNDTKYLLDTESKFLPQERVIVTAKDELKNEIIETGSHKSELHFNKDSAAVVSVTCKHNSIVRERDNKLWKKSKKSKPEQEEVNKEMKHSESSTSSFCVSTQEQPWKVTTNRVFCEGTSTCDENLQEAVCHISLEKQNIIEEKEVGAKSRLQSESVDCNVDEQKVSVETKTVVVTCADSASDILSVHSKSESEIFCEGTLLGPLIQVEHKPDPNESHAGQKEIVVTNDPVATSGSMNNYILNALIDDDDDDEEPKDFLGWSPTTEDEESDEPLHLEDINFEGFMAESDQDSADHLQLLLNLRAQQRRRLVSHRRQKASDMQTQHNGSNLSARSTENQDDGIKKRRVMVGHRGRGRGRGRGRRKIIVKVSKESSGSGDASGETGTSSSELLEDPKEKEGKKSNKVMRGRKPLKHKLPERKPVRRLTKVKPINKGSSDKKMLIVEKRKTRSSETEKIETDEAEETEHHYSKHKKIKGNENRKVEETDRKEMEGNINKEGKVIEENMVERSRKRVVDGNMRKGSEVKEKRNNETGHCPTKRPRRRKPSEVDSLLMWAVASGSTSGSRARERHVRNKDEERGQELRKGEDCKTRALNESEEKERRVKERVDNRGRWLRKRSESSDTNIARKEQSEESEPKQIRPRGRPRKHPVEVKRRGRTRKLRQGVSDDEQEEEEEPRGKRREQNHSASQTGTEEELPDLTKVPLAKGGTAVLLQPGELVWWQELAVTGIGSGTGTWWPGYVEQVHHSRRQAAVCPVGRHRNTCPPRLDVERIKTFQPGFTPDFVDSNVKGLTAAVQLMEMFCQLQQHGNTITPQQFFSMPPEEQDSFFITCFTPKDDPQDNKKTPEKADEEEMPLRGRKHWMYEPLTFEDDREDDDMFNDSDDELRLSARDRKKMQGAIRARRRENERLLKFMQSSPCVRYLWRIFDGEEPCERHHLYQDEVSRRSLLWSGLGPFQLDHSDDQILSVVDFLCTELTKNRPDYKLAHDYVLRVWIPEAIKEALRVIKKVPEEELEAALDEGYRETKTERKARRLNFT